MVLSFATLFERTQRHQSQHVRRVVESVSIFSELHFNILRGDLPFRVLGHAGAVFLPVLVLVSFVQSGRCGR